MSFSTSVSPISASSRSNSPTPSPNPKEKPGTTSQAASPILAYFSRLPNIVAHSIKRFGKRLSLPQEKSNPSQEKANDVAQNQLNPKKEKDVFTFPMRIRNLSFSSATLFREIGIEHDEEDMRIPKSKATSPIYVSDSSYVSGFSQYVRFCLKTGGVIQITATSGSSHAQFL